MGTRVGVTHLLKGMMHAYFVLTVRGRDSLQREEKVENRKKWIESKGKLTFDMSFLPFSSASRVCIFFFRISFKRDEMGGKTRGRELLSFEKISRLETCRKKKKWWQWNQWREKERYKRLLLHGKEDEGAKKTMIIRRWWWWRREEGGEDVSDEE